MPSMDSNIFPDVTNCNGRLWILLNESSLCGGRNLNSNIPARVQKGRRLFVQRLDVLSGAFEKVAEPVQRGVRGEMRLPLQHLAQHRES